MKTYILFITLILFSSVQFAQQINYSSMLVHNEEESFIKNKIYLLIKSLNESDGKYLSSVLTSDVISKNKKSIIKPVL